ncbi:hypothetical protein TVAG_480910 [Trichomonas vaginalis G3]|uniref:F5/8 type C domain-containing protein n=1 Tax=Trichomonas vaginalis (strain ATCC PRA-98 / G3) TaxID=412133 RepID=A2F8N7_TRIV3|nr:hypothetical protein TVAGG3_0456490 [Trichomonas vaginalis G3]EAX98715.1 hypothetical protein TVAG_480910 [Trichomonas vaginalis G3]KAI5538504.1 hypothetical protein TVAGG3_0456490 [Trichomonas vaginalis G3]|eukprot:XP_001311645.1 hypothetical protein [Trichomonas vaginalis G3]
MISIFLVCENLLTDSNSILKSAYQRNLVEYYVSGSAAQYINGSYQKTKPEYAFDQIDKKYDWCSNCGRKKEEFPYIVLGVKNKMMNVQGYYIKAGCCDRDCCCYEEGYYCCECCMYSWNFQISTDNTTWKTVSKVEKDKEMRKCNQKTYKFSESYPAKYVRLIQTEACPGDPPCIALNKIEIIGNTDGTEDGVFEFEAEDEDISIIGHIGKQHNSN